MKRIISFVLIVAGLLALSACVQVRNTPPRLIGVENTVSFTYGEQTFNPRTGISAEDDADGDLTNAIELEGWNDEWLDDPRGGQYSYSVYVEDKDGLFARQTVSLTIIGNVPQTVSLLYVQEVQTYYLGSRPFDPIRGVKAIDTFHDPENPDDLTEDIEVLNLPNITRPGRYNYQLRVTNEFGASTTKSVVLVVRLGVSNIPTTLTTAPITLTLWHSNGSTIEGAMKKYAEDFNKIYPNITINIVKNGENYDKLRQNTVAAIQGGTLPNIVQGYPDHMVEYKVNNAIVSMNPYIDHPVWGFDPEVENDRFEDIVWKYRNENSAYHEDGEYYSLPFNKSTEVMIYNQDAVQALIDAGKITKFPDTWQDLFALSSEFETIAPGFIDSYGSKLSLTGAEIQTAKSVFVPYSYDSEENAFITLLRQWGGRYTSLDSSRKGVANYNSEEAINMLTYFNTHKDKLTLSANWKSDYASDIFKKGQTFMTIGSTGGAYYNTPSIVGGEYLFNFEVAPIPYNKDMPEHRAAIQQGTNLSVTNTGTDQEKLASYLFIKYLNSEEVQVDFTLKTGYQPTRTSAYLSDAYTTFMNGFAQDGTTALEGEDLMRSKAARAAALQSDFLFFDEAFIGSSGIREAVGVTFKRIVLPTDTDTVLNALAYAVSEAERLLGKDNVA